MAAPHSTRDLPVFNRWICLTRIRAALMVTLFAVAVNATVPGSIQVPPVLAVCATLIAAALGSLALPPSARASLGFFVAQSFIDVAGITLGIAFATEGTIGLLMHSIYALVIVPASLLSVPAGLIAVAACTLGHGILIGLEHGFGAGMLISIEFLVPAFLFLMVAQQSFFYGGHLAAKNEILSRLFEQLQASERRLAVEGKVAAAVADTARTLSAALDQPEPLSRVSDAICARLGADWGAIFVVNDQERFQLRGLTGPGQPGIDAGRIELPLTSWPALGSLASDRVLELERGDLARLPLSFTGGQALASGLLAALYRDGHMVGFVALGWATPLGAARDWARTLLVGIAEHTTVVLQNARLLEEVRQASALKSEFVGAVSHELRSPLNVILGYLEMACDGALGPLTPDLHEALARTQRQSITLLEMITALLDLNRFEAGRLPVESTMVAIPELLGEVVEQVPETWRRADVALRLEPPSGPTAVETDRGKLKTVMRNLVHNALKFTQRGHVTLSARMEPDGAVLLTVADTGCGIPPDALPYVFDMFRQVPGSAGGGVGLGLHIVRRFVDALGGEVSVRSDLGVGTRFTIRLPPQPPGTERSVEAA